MQVVNEYFKGKGTAYLRDRSIQNSGLLAIGNASEISLALSVATQNMQDYENAGGGLADSISSIESANATITIANLNPVNVARATAGKLTVVEAVAVTDEEHVVNQKGSLIKFNKVPDMSQSVTLTTTISGSWAATTAVAEGDLIIAGSNYYKATVAGTTDSTEPAWPTDGSSIVDGTATWLDMGATPATFVEGTDYEKRNGGILILDGGSIAEGLTIKATYQGAKSRTVESLLEVGKEYEMYFDGLNEARNGKAVLATMHRVKLDPTQALPLISDDYATMQLNVVILKDESITGSEKSKYVKVEMAE